MTIFHQTLVQRGLAAASVVALLATTTAVSASARTTSAPYPSHLLTIPTLGGSLNTAVGINDAGVVTGWSWTKSGAVHAFAYDTKTTVLTDLGDLGGGLSEARAINDHGIIVGFSSNAAGQDRAFRYDLSTHTMSDLGALYPDADFSEANGIDDAGVIVGDSAYRPSTTLDDAADRHAFRWDPTTGTMTDLGEPGSGHGSQASAVNDAGIVVGESLVQAVVWDPPAFTPTVVDGDSSNLGAINGAGLAVGSWQNHVTGQVEPLTFDTGTHALTVIPIPAANDAGAAAIGEDGTIVGSTDVRTYGDDVFVIDPGTTVLHDLGRFGTVSMEPSDINADHSIVGTYVQGSTDRAFVLSTTVLPSPVTTTTVSGPTTGVTAPSAPTSTLAPASAEPATAVSAVPTFTG